MPRFVILEHDHPRRHWDLMLEEPEGLRTWRLPTPPAPGVPLAIEALAPHRCVYLDYEGPVSGNRGQVRRWDAGTFTWETQSADRLSVHLCGTHCRGGMVLTRDDETGWRLAYAPDQEAG